MVEKARRDKIIQNAHKRQRSAFRDEFYREGDGGRRARRRGSQGAGNRRGRSQGLPAWVFAATSGILLCVIAVAGSSAMIWLRKLGAIFGVHWAGD